MNTTSSPVSFYDIVSVVDNRERLKYVALVVTLSIALTSYLSSYINVSHLFALSFISTVLPVVYSIWQYNTSSFIRDMDLKITTLDPEDNYEYLYTDANLVNLLYSVYDFKKFAPEQFEEILDECNTLLNLRSDFDTGELSNPASQYAVAERLARTILNHYHALIFVLPSANYYKLFTESFKRIRIIVRRQLDAMAQRARLEPVNSHKRYVHRADLPKSFDPDSTDLVLL